MILDKVIEFLLVNNADPIVKSDTCYVKMLEEIDTMQEELDNANLNAEQKRAANNLLSAYNAAADAYALIAYKQGLLDAVKLLQELQIIR